MRSARPAEAGSDMMEERCSWQRCWNAWGDSRKGSIGSVEYGRNGVVEVKKNERLKKIVTLSRIDFRFDTGLSIFRLFVSLLTGEAIGMNRCLLDSGCGQ